MMTVYLGALAFGGTLLAASLLLGDVDTDADIDIDADADVDIQAEADAGTPELAAAWLPVTSMRFWTFFLTFFGLTGAALSWSGAGVGAVGAGVIATAVGYLCGAAIANAVKHLKASAVDSTLTGDDYIGSTATVVLPVTADRPGTVRASIKGRLVDLVAETEEPVRLERSTTVLVYALRENGRVLVSRADRAAA